MKWKDHANLNDLPYRAMHFDPAFQRLQLLIGKLALQRLRDSRVILFGVGGVGSWCAEALVRSGIRRITIVDNDTVCITNINRQLQATKTNIGLPKVDELRKRLATIHPDIEIESIGFAYENANRSHFDLANFDYVIDAIDSYTHKMELIEHAHKVGTPLFSSMGAAGRLDVTRIRTASIWDVRMDRFSKILRKGLRRRGFNGNLRCVYSEEPAIVPSEEFTEGTAHTCTCQNTVSSTTTWNDTKRIINGSAVHVTAAFGMALAGLVIQDIRCKCEIEASSQPHI